LSGTPLDPLVHLLTSLAITIGAAAVATVSIVMFLRWLGLHWTGRCPPCSSGRRCGPSTRRRRASRPRPRVRHGDRGRARIAMTSRSAATTPRSRATAHPARRHANRRAAPRRQRRAVDRPPRPGGRPRRTRAHRPRPGRAPQRPPHVRGRRDGVGQDRHAGIVRRAPHPGGHGAVVIDPKGDWLLRDELEHAARQARRALWLWTPEGPAVYNPFAARHGHPSWPTG
jgi:hypothetical protein